MLMNKTTTECWNILKYEIESIIDKFVLEINTCQKKLLEKQCSSKLCGRFIGVPERMKAMQITKRHLMQLQLKLDSLKEAVSKN